MRIGSRAALALLGGCLGLAPLSGCAEDHVIGTRGLLLAARLPAVKSVRMTGTALLPAPLVRGAQLAIGDLDGDGNFDLAVAEGASAQVCILAGMDGQSFEEPRCIASGLREPATAILAVKVTSPGPMVLIAASSDELALLRADRTAAGFSVAAPVVTTADLAGTHFAALSAADLATVPLGPNASDGKQSLLVSDAGHDRIVIYPLSMSAAPTSFVQLDKPYHYATGPRPGALLLGDLDGDRRVDFVTADLGDSARSLSPSLTLIRAGDRITQPGCTDTNFERPYALALSAPAPTDAAPFLIAADSGRTPTALTLTLSPSDPKFFACESRLSAALTAQLSPDAAVLLGVDLDGDGHADLVHGSAQGLSVVPSRYQRESGFPESLLVLKYPAATVGAAIAAVRAADLDGSGRPALVVLGDDGAVTLWKNGFP